ncbi:MAG: YbdK family carboxylate-amine ligase [Thermoleophilia bacterium]|nr:YbdK family carboxylate-amine ligase [Thermoleophilia bacterium]
MNWTPSQPLTLGVEEELMILDAATLELVPRVHDFLGRDGFKTELFATMLELNTPVCQTPGEAGERLRELRAEAARAAAANGLAIAAGGSHPLAVPEDQELVDEPRYLEFAEYAGVSARRQVVHGLHVHVGMPDQATCLRVLEGLLPWLPFVLALSANSPYFAGRETGLLSTRAQVLGELPRHGAPPVEWEAAVERMVGLGLVDDFRALHWDVRPHPLYGTLEIRIADQPTALERTVELVAVLHRLCGELLDGDSAPADRALYEEARWAAAHYGPRARLPHPREDRLVTVAELELGLEPTCEADRQLGLGPEAALADIVERSWPR